MAKAAAPASGKRAGKSGSFRWLQGLVCGALVALATPTALLGGVLLLPTLICALFESGSGKPLTRAVMLCGLAGSALPMMALWNGGHSMGQSLALVTDLSVVAVAWASQAAGGLAAELIPLLVRLSMDAQMVATTASLRHQRAKLAEDWEGLGSPESAARSD